MKSTFLVVGGVVVAGLLGGAFYLYSTLDNQEVATVDDALAEFRAGKPPEATPRPGLPKQGIYRYTVVGDEKIKRGAVIDVERTFPPQATAVIRHRTDGFEFETRYSEQHTELSRYELQDEGAYVTFAVTNLVVGPSNNTVERTWTPKLLRLPSEAKRPTSPTWGGDFTAGTLKLNITNEYLAKETLTVGSTAVPVDVIQSTQKITGEYTGDRTETFWYSPKLGLIIKYSIASSLKGPTDLDFNVTQTLVSAEPEV